PPPATINRGAQPWDPSVRGIAPWVGNMTFPALPLSPVIHPLQFKLAPTVFTPLVRNHANSVNPTHRHLDP
ncbi:MAG: hypothetical protein ACO4AJ_12250, partial [Prochlorothrix sp.]